MGWKLTAASKRAVCARGNELVSTACNTIVFDMNATCRRDFVWASSDITPRAAVGIFWRRHVLPHKEAHTFYFAFDSPDRVPEARLTYLATERYAKSVDHGCKAFTADFMEATWPEVWASASAKRMMWELVASLLYDTAMQLGAPNVKYIVDPPAGPILRCPREDGPLRYSNFGEADLKAALFATEQAVGEVVVYTIDWDMVVQGVAVMPSNVVVDLGATWRDGAKQYFSKRNAPSTAVRVRERIRPFIFSGRERLSKAFLLLAAAGVDYCDGLKRFGYREADMVNLLTLSPPRFLWREDGIYHFDVNTFVKHMRSVKPTRARSSDIAEFNKEIGRMLFCVLYFAFAGRWEARGGPVLPEHNFFPGARTVPDAMSGARIYPVYAFDE